MRCEGKGRKQRAVPLTGTTQKVLQIWLAERAVQARDPLFPTRTGRRLSSDAIEQRVQDHAVTATKKCRNLGAKNLHPHVFRHYVDVHITAIPAPCSSSEAGVDISVIALWLGHESIASTQIYMHADLAVKQHALNKMMPFIETPNRYRAPDSLLDYLEAL